ncbi:restriction endonuclease Mrr [Litorivivens lipolytica]|uniref:Restriction endonuclease Mrr n=1 Tax=Litorivivens lipolytica TaxID=1524264 RepID=A0A7W4Z8H2_9GAMM|nr:restriction endonuclease [Litorivivens lipolytica]MBB3048961.1 restriction endonuclease Mrr [Litorivivens lipolytica]
MLTVPTGETCPTCSGPLVRDTRSIITCPKCTPDEQPAPSDIHDAIEGESEIKEAIDIQEIVARIYIMVFIGSGIAAFGFDKDGAGVVFGLGVLIAIFWGAVAGSQQEEERKDELLQRQRKHIESVSKRYADVLARKRRQLIIKDDYGDIDDIAWKKEIETFVNKKVNPFPENAIDAKLGVHLSGNEIAEIVDQIARNAQESAQALPYEEAMDGIEYEHFCASLLQASGWDARVSQASGDQGIDIEARKEGVSVVIQCKKYSSPVGNKAVQEALSGKQFAGADYAVVVTNASFTPSAKKLAAASGAILLHHEQLVELETILKECSTTTVQA